MGLFFKNKKEKITEPAAAKEFVRRSFSDTEDEWLKIKESMSQVLPEGVGWDVNDGWASNLLALAVISRELRGIKDLFEERQAKRLHDYVLTSVNVSRLKGPGHETLKLFEEAIEKGLTQDQVTQEVYLLLRFWFSNHMEKLEVSRCEDCPKTVDPNLILSVENAVAAFTGYWQEIKDKYQLTE